jgi:hypothetical protein
MSNGSNLKYTKTIDKDSISARIGTIKELMYNTNIETFVDFDNTATEYYNGEMYRDDNASGMSYDTRISLNKNMHNFNIITQFGGELKYIKSGSTGHVFYACAEKIIDGEKKDVEYAIKIVAYPNKDTKYGNIYDTRRPENAELKMIKTLSYFVVKGITPHIILPIANFYTKIKRFVNLIDENVVKKSNEKYVDFVNKYKKGEFHDEVSVLITEWANRGDLLDFFRQNYDNPKFTLVMWKTIFFQVLSVLAVIQYKYPGFRHNDLKANNILVHKVTAKNERWKYYINKTTYRVPNIGYSIKLVDFDFSCIPDIVENNKVDHSWTDRINVHAQTNRYYDIHYFFNTLIKKGFCHEIMKSSCVSEEVKDFINRVVPDQFKIPKKGTTNQQVDEKGRILINDEYTTPDKLLQNDPFFDDFRVNTNKINNIKDILHKDPHDILINNIKKIKVDSEKNHRDIEKIKQHDKEKRISNRDEKIKCYDKEYVIKDKMRNSKKHSRKKETSRKKNNNENKPNLKKFLQEPESNNIDIQLNNLLLKMNGGKINKKSNKSKSKARTISEELRKIDTDRLLNGN